MDDKVRFSRSEMILGEEGVTKLRKKRVALFGLGGVGGAALEALARNGIGTLYLIDDDVFNESNLNRQLLSTVDCIGRSKVEVAKERVHSIDPSIEVLCLKMFYLPENREKIPFESFDYIIDAIETVKAKVDLALVAKEKRIPLISALGCGNRLDPSKLAVTDISKTYNDPFAKVMRKALKESGITDYKVVFSTEPPVKVESKIEEESASKKHIPGSLFFVPNAAGIYLAYEAISYLLK